MGKPLSVNPLKTSPAMGAAIALQGIRGALPLLHAAPGCTFLTKVVMTNHSREPVGLLGTDIKEMSTIMGGQEAIEAKILDIHGKQNPELVAILSTALAHVRGEDVDGALNSAREKIDMPMIHVETPDYKGGFAEGFGKAVLALAQSFARKGETIPDLVNLIPAPYMTPADIEEIAEIIESFGYRTLILPDLASALDGSKDRFSAKPLDGTSVSELEKLGRAAFTLTIGKSVESAGEYLSAEFEVEHFALEGIYGIQATDRLIRILLEKSGREASKRIKRHRRRLADAMIDAHMVLYGKEVALGLEGDHTLAFLRFFAEVGIKPASVILPVAAKLPEDLPGKETARVGDLGDLEIELKTRATDGKRTHLMITNSHGVEVESRTGIPLLRAGYPVYDRFGETLRLRAGYRGAAELIFELTRVFMEADHSGPAEKTSQHATMTASQNGK